MSQVVYKYQNVYDWCSKNVPDLSIYQIRAFITARGRSCLSEDEIIKEMERLLFYKGHSILHWCRKNKIDYRKFRMFQGNNDAKLAVEAWLAGKRLPVEKKQTPNTRCMNCDKRNCEGCPFYLYNGMSAVTSVIGWRSTISRLRQKYNFEVMDGCIITPNYKISRYGKITGKNNSIIVNSIEEVIDIVEKEYSDVG